MLGVVVPCYNEEENIDALVNAFERLRGTLEFELIFVNDGSIDGSLEKISGHAQRLGWIAIVNHEENLGLAQSLKDGFSHALEEGYDLIAYLDCDMTHPPSLLKAMSKEIEEADLVVASRYAPGGGMEDVPGWRVMISRFGNRLFGVLLRVKTLDTTSGFRLGRRKVFENLVLEEDSFGIQLELTVRAERALYRIKEVPFVLVSRRKGSSKFRLRYLLGYIPLALRLMVRG